MSRFIDIEPVILQAHEQMKDYVSVELLVSLSAVEMVDIVRCKDCVWRNDDSSPSWLPCMAIETNDDFYCATGIRRRNEQIH